MSIICGRRRCRSQGVLDSGVEVMLPVGMAVNRLKVRALTLSIQGQRLANDRGHRLSRLYREKIVKVSLTRVKSRDRDVQATLQLGGRRRSRRRSLRFRRLEILDELLDELVLASVAHRAGFRMAVDDGKQLIAHLLPVPHGSLFAHGSEPPQVFETSS